VDASLELDATSTTRAGRQPGNAEIPVKQRGSSERTETELNGKLPSGIPDKNEFDRPYFPAFSPF
jgi:hypothetical protein